MLDSFASTAHCLRIGVETCLHRFEDMLVLPPGDAPLRRALCTPSSAGSCRTPSSSSDALHGPVVQEEILAQGKIAFNIEAHPTEEISKRHGRILPPRQRPEVSHQTER